MKLKYFLSGALLAIVLFLAACSGNGEEEVEAESQGEEESGEVEKDDKNLVIAQASDLVTMDPQDSLSTTGDRFFRNLNNRLFKRNPDMEIVPDLVESSENIDEETWRFKLIEGVKFHNGEDLTAEDVKFSLERVMTDDSLKEYPYFTQLKEVNVIDDYELEVVTDGPMPTIQHVLAKSGSGILPKDYVEEVGMEGFMEQPIGSGPYKFVEWKIDDKVVMGYCNDSCYK